MQTDQNFLLYKQQLGGCNIQGSRLISNIKFEEQWSRLYKRLNLETDPNCPVFQGVSCG